MKSKPIRWIVAAAVSLIALGLPAAGQEADAEGCRDHPMFSRMKSYYIQECEHRDFDEADFYIQDRDSKTVEGRKTRLEYAVREGQTPASHLQIRRNYGNAVKALGGTILLDDDTILSAKVVKDGREVWLQVTAFNDGEGYSLVIVEAGAMTQEVTAGEMLAALNKAGFIALYIQFDTGKSEIKPEAAGAISQIVSLLTENEDLRVGIEGHTDDVGTPAANKSLSEARAKAVLAAVVKGGVAAERLSAIGWGQEKPISDNRTEEGRAKNRRVEIVKK